MSPFWSSHLSRSCRSSTLLDLSDNVGHLCFHSGVNVVHLVGLISLQNIVFVDLPDLFALPFLSLCPLSLLLLLFLQVSLHALSLLFPQVWPPPALVALPTSVAPRFLVALFTSAAPPALVALSVSVAPLAHVAFCARVAPPTRVALPALVVLLTHVALLFTFAIHVLLYNLPYAYAVRVLPLQSASCLHYSHSASAVCPVHPLSFLCLHNLSRE